MAEMNAVTSHALVLLNTLESKKYFTAWIGQQEILAVHTPDGVRIYSAMCPHQGGPLGEGTFDQGTVTCPWHGCQFDLQKGKCVDYGVCINVSNMNLTPIPFEVKEGMIYVQLGQ